VNGGYRSDEISFRTVSLPEVKGEPLIGHWEIPVDFFQLHIKSIAELPKGIVYIDYRYLAHRCIILRIVFNVYTALSITIFLRILLKILLDLARRSHTIPEMEPCCLHNEDCGSPRGCESAVERYRKGSWRSCHRGDQEAPSVKIFCHFADNIPKGDHGEYPGDISFENILFKGRPAARNRAMQNPIQTHLD
jgi:hypothetical protein